MNNTTNEFRILIETNVFISAIVKPNSASRRCINYVLDCHKLLIGSYSIDEVFRIVGERFPEAQAVWDSLLTGMDFELIYTPKHIDFPYRLFGIDPMNLSWLLLSSLNPIF